MRSGRIVKPKRFTFISHNVKWDLNVSVCILLTSVFDLSQFSSERSHRDILLGTTACLYAKDMTVQSGKQVDFGDVRRLVVCCIEHN